MEMRDISWLGRLAEAQEVARARGIPVAIKALGQGVDTCDDW